MPLGTLILVPTLFGFSEAIRTTQSSARKKEHRSRKCNLIVRCAKSSQYSSALQDRQVVLSQDKLYIDTGTSYDTPFGQPFAGYFLAYPDSKFDGLVSAISSDPPIMNWIYVDRETLELKYGNRAAAEPNHPGPFDCTRQEKRLIFGGWEGFLAVKEGGFWAVYFDRDGDMLKEKIADGVPILEIELCRVEARQQKRAPRPRSDDEDTSKDPGAETQEPKPEEKVIQVTGESPSS